MSRHARFCEKVFAFFFFGTIEKPRDRIFRVLESGTGTTMVLATAIAMSLTYLLYFEVLDLFTLDKIRTHECNTVTFHFIFCFI